MHFEIAGWSVVDAQRIDAESRDLALHQPSGRFHAETGKMHYTLRVGIPIWFALLPTRAPSGVGNHHALRGNRAVPLFPRIEVCQAQQVIRVLLHGQGDVHDNSRRDELPQCQLAHHLAILVAAKVRWCVDVRSKVFRCFEGTAIDVELGFFRVLLCRESHRRKEHRRRRAYLLSQIQNPASRYPYLRQGAAR